MPLPNNPEHHQCNAKREERRHAKHPAHTHSSLPIHHKERGRKAEGEAVAVERDRGFDRVVHEAFDAIVVTDGQSKQGGEPDEEGGERAI